MKNPRPFLMGVAFEERFFWGELLQKLNEGQKSLSLFPVRPCVIFSAGKCAKCECLLTIEFPVL